MQQELHSIKPFRGGNLGIIRLNFLSYTDCTKITVGDEEFYPIGHDTYGHPIISEKNFAYYRALKAIRERDGESLIAEVEYKPQPFCVRSDIYDSAEGIQKIIDGNSLKEFKKILIYRKQANFYNQVINDSEKQPTFKKMNTFIVFEKYALHSDGHIYMCSYERKVDSITDQDNLTKDVFDLSAVNNFKLHEEVHLPGEDDVCAICGKHFNMEDVRTFSVVEDQNCKKAHRDCLDKYTVAVEYQEASRIIDMVYREYPKSEIITEHDKKSNKDKVWYLYHTKQGDVAIHFKNKVIEIKWFGNFKPFNLKTLFKDEDVTKKSLKDAKVIHAWSSDDAVKYLTMVKKA